MIKKSDMQEEDEMVWDPKNNSKDVPVFVQFH